MIKRSWMAAVAAAALFTGCSNHPYQELQTASQERAVYVYWLDRFTNDTSYDVLVDGKYVGEVRNNGYVAASVGTGTHELIVRHSDPVKAHLQKAVLQIDATGADAHYVKIRSPFKVAEAEAATAREEIRNTERHVGILDYSSSEEKPQESAATVAQTSPAATEEKTIAALERLSALKEKGAITEEEFAVLKAKILAD